MMSQELSIDASQALIDLIFVGLNYGIDVVRDGGGPLAPVVLMNDTNGERTSPVMVGAKQLDDAIAGAYQIVANVGEHIAMYAIVLDAYLTIEGQKYDAVLVEGGERGKPFAFQFGQRYRPARDGTPFETIGNPAFLGQTDQRLTG